MSEVNPALVLHSIQGLQFEDRPIPKLRNEHDVRVHIQRTGICGSDVHCWQKGRIGDLIVKEPLILGHESSGIIGEVGSAVRNVQVGDRVAIEPSVPCRRCDYCRSGAYSICNETAFAAMPHFDGTLQKYYVVASDYVYPLPDHMSLEDGALAEPAAVAVQVVKVSDVRAGQTVVVFGCGPIGILYQSAVKAYRARKAIGVDITESRTNFAKEFTSDGVYVVPSKSLQVNTIDASRALADQILAEFYLGEGADVVLECTGAESCIQAGVFTAKKGGILVVAGLGRDNVTIPVTTLALRALTIRGTVPYTTGCYPQAVKLIADGKVKASKLIAHCYKFSQAKEAFDKVKRVREDTLKVIIEGVPQQWQQNARMDTLVHSVNICYQGNL